MARPGIGSSSKRIDASPAKPKKANAAVRVRKVSWLKNQFGAQVDLTASSGFTLTYSATDKLYVQLRPGKHWDGGAKWVDAKVFANDLTGVPDVIFPFDPAYNNNMLNDDGMPRSGVWSRFDQQDLSTEELRSLFASYLVFCLPSLACLWPSHGLRSRSQLLDS